jgi:hypothetical protein
LESPPFEPDYAIYPEGYIRPPITIINTNLGSPIPEEIPEPTENQEQPIQGPSGLQKDSETTSSETSTSRKRPRKRATEPPDSSPDDENSPKKKHKGKGKRSKKEGPIRLN